MDKDAIFSPCRTYRYALFRTWDSEKRRVAFIGLNPSTADETKDDPTIRRCIGYAKNWGYGGLCMLNLFAYRATDPRDMKAVSSPVGDSNDATLIAMTSGAGVVIAAWGVHGAHMGRDEKVKRLLPGLHYLRLTKGGHPAHPLYLPKTLTPIPFAA